MCKHDDACNATEGECMNTDNLRVKWVEVEASVWEAQQAELKALREDNRKQSLEIEHLDGCVTNWKKTSERLESQLIELRQGGEAVYQAKGPDSKEWTEVSKPKFDFYQDSPEIGVEVRILYTAPQSLEEIKADRDRWYGAAQERQIEINALRTTNAAQAERIGELEKELRKLALIIAGETDIKFDRLDKARALLAAAPSVPVAEGDK